MGKKKKNKSMKKQIASREFMTMSSIREIVVRGIMVDDDPEYYFYTKKGKVEDLNIKKRTMVKIQLDGVFKVVKNGDVIEPMSVMKDENNSKRELKSYLIKFKDFQSCIQTYILSGNAAPKLISAVNTKTGEIKNLWDVALANAEIVYGDKLKHVCDLLMNI